MRTREGEEEAAAEQLEERSVVEKLIGGEVRSGAPSKRLLRRTVKGWEAREVEGNIDFRAWLAELVAKHQGSVDR